MDHNETYFVYIVKCADGTLYTGVTNDLCARLNKHNLGQGAKYTRGRGPVTLAYYERLPGLSLALKREIMIKKMSRAAKLALVKSGPIVAGSQGFWAIEFCEVLNLFSEDDRVPRV